MDAMNILNPSSALPRHARKIRPIVLTLWGSSRCPFRGSFPHCGFFANYRVHRANAWRTTLPAAKLHLKFSVLRQSACDALIAALILKHLPGNAPASGRWNSSNVKEHATLSARAHVDHGVEVECRKRHVNRAADRGCVSRFVRFVILHRKRE
jgi:hypothetical protein